MAGKLKTLQTHFGLDVELFMALSFPSDEIIAQPFEQFSRTLGKHSINSAETVKSESIHSSQKVRIKLLLFLTDEIDRDLLLESSSWTAEREIVAGLDPGPVFHGGLRETECIELYGQDEIAPAPHTIKTDVLRSHLQFGESDGRGKSQA
jgi:hypothetical protein